MDYEEILTNFFRADSGDFKAVLNELYDVYFLYVDADKKEREAVYVFKEAVMALLNSKEK